MEAVPARSSVEAAELAVGTEPGAAVGMAAATAADQRGRAMREAAEVCRTKRQKRTSRGSIVYIIYIIYIIPPNRCNLNGVLTVLVKGPMDPTPLWSFVGEC